MGGGCDGFRLGERGLMVDGCAQEVRKCSVGVMGVCEVVEQLLFIDARIYGDVYRVLLEVNMLLLLLKLFYFADSILEMIFFLHFTTYILCITVYAKFTV